MKAPTSRRPIFAECFWFVPQANEKGKHTKLGKLGLTEPRQSRLSYPNRSGLVNVGAAIRFDRLAIGNRKAPKTMNISSSSPRVSKIVFLVGDSTRDRNQLSALKAELSELAAWSVAEVRELLERLPSMDLSSKVVLLAIESILQSIASRFLSQSRDVARRQAEIDELIGELDACYLRLSPNAASRNYVLGILAAGGSRQSLARFAELLIDDPPSHSASLGLAMAPLISLPQPNLGDLFPRLLDGLQHQNLAAAILDVANHAYSSGKLTAHPALARAAALIGLLRQLVDKLSAVEEGNSLSSVSGNLEKVIAETVALAVSTCHTLGLVGDSAARPELLRALNLKHRRIRTESAGALAQLGDPAGAAALVELAQWPVARLRALAYADEYGLIDQIDPQYRTQAARAESELAVWLSEPAQFGLAPTEMNLLDQRELFWPGYNEPQQCYLFRFSYRTNQGVWSNIGIAGPAIHAASASLEHLSHEESYALFAGWQTSHENIYEIDLRDLPEKEKAAIARQQAEQEEHGFDEIVPAFVGRFLGDEFVVAAALKGDQAGHLIWSPREMHWLADASRKLTSELAYCIFKGRKLLASFNPDYRAASVLGG